MLLNEYQISLQVAGKSLEETLKELEKEVEKLDPTGTTEVRLLIAKLAGITAFVQREGRA